MLHLALTLALSGLTAPLPVPEPQADPTLLHAVPADALLVVYSPDLGDVRGVVLESPWYRYFAAGPGREYLELGLEMMQGMEPDAKETLALCRPLTGLCQALGGEALLFVTTDGLGIVLETGTKQAAADQALTSFLEGLPVGWTLSAAEHEGVGLQLWQPDDEDFFIGRAMADGVTALFLGEDGEAVAGALREGIDDYQAGELSVDAQRIAERLRGGVPRLVFTADLRKDARLLAELGDAGRQGKRVIEALGLDREAWVLADVHQSPGGALHEVVKVRFEPETGLARLADSFSPVEMTDLAGLPAGTNYFGVARWNASVFADAVLEIAGPEARKTWRNAVQAGKSATGVHLRHDIIDQFTGLFAFFSTGASHADLFAVDPLQGGTVLIGVRDGDELANTLFALLDVTGSGDLIDIDDVHGLDVWSFGEQAGLDEELAAMPRLVFAPEAVLLVSAAEDLERVVAPFTGAGRPSLADDSAPVETLRRHSGAFFAGYQELASAAATMTYQLHGLAELFGLQVSDPPDRATLKSWFPGRAVSSWRRTADGLEFRTTIQ